MQCSHEIPRVFSNHVYLLLIRRVEGKMKIPPRSSRGIYSSKYAEFLSFHGIRLTRYNQIKKSKVISTGIWNSVILPHEKRLRIKPCGYCKPCQRKRDCGFCKSCVNKVKGHQICIFKKCLVIIEIQNNRRKLQNACKVLLVPLSQQQKQQVAS